MCQFDVAGRDWTARQVNIIYNMLPKDFSLIMAPLLTKRFSQIIVVLEIFKIISTLTLYYNNAFYRFHNESIIWGLLFTVFVVLSWGMGWYAKHIYQKIGFFTLGCDSIFQLLSQFSKIKSSMYYVVSVILSGIILIAFLRSIKKKEYNQ